MKILHISSEKSWRGGEQQIAYLINELAEKGEQNIVICRKGSAFETYCKKEGIKFFSTSFSGTGILSAAATIMSVAHKEAVDIIHLHTAKAHLVAYISLIFGNKTPMVLSRRVDFKPKSGWFTKQRYNHRGIKRILCVSKAIEEIMIDYLEVRKERCVTVHSGVDFEKYNTAAGFSIKEKYNIPDEAYIVGNTSALADHKDYFSFVDTAEQLIRKSTMTFHFLILGKGPLEKEIKTYCDQKDLTTHFTFVGFVDNVSDYLKQFNVFLITSKTEGLGTSIIDAFACGIPVVATAAGGIPELVIDGKTGLLAEVGDSTKLAQNIEQLLNEHELTKALIDGAHKHKQQFSKQSMAHSTLNVYHEILES